MIVCGIGDPHFDGRLRKIIPDLNQFIASEIRSVVTKAAKKGARVVILYGDIGDSPKLSYESHILLTGIFNEFPNLLFVVMKGNHDHEDAGTTGLDYLAFQAKSGMLPNVKVILKPTMLFKNTDCPVNIQPWSHESKYETHKGALNVLHTEVAGSVMDSGLAFKGGLAIKHKSVSGHLHTNQIAGRTYYAGTLYQTSFGQRFGMFWHLINDLDVTSVPHKPKYELRNVVIKKRDDLLLIPDDPTVLVKAFIHGSVTLSERDLSAPNIVKTNSYKSKEELQALVMEDFAISDESGTVSYDLDNALTDWLDTQSLKPSLRKRVIALNKKFTEKT